MNTARFISTFPQTIGEVRRLLTLNDNKFSASNQLLDMGIYICPQCAYYNNIEVTHCKHCSAEKFIIKNK
jgi:hypothetical protein